MRAGLISPLLHSSLERGEVTAHLTAIAAQTHHIPYSTRTTVDEETVWRYLARPRAGGFEALAEQVDIVCSCLPGPADVAKVYLGANGEIDA